jgi:hypothetical protein
MMLTQNFNIYKNAAVLEADSPQALAAIIANLRVPVKILGFTDDGKGKKYFAYVNFKRKIGVKNVISK